MLNFMPIGKVGGDCTCPYSVMSDTPLTVAELVQQILTRKEWGNIDFYYEKIEWGTAISTVNYDGAQLNNVDDIFAKIREKPVIKIKASGGWTRMDYDVLIEENLNKMKITVYTLEDFRDDYEHGVIGVYGSFEKAKEELIHVLKEEIMSYEDELDECEEDEERVEELRSFIVELKESVKNVEKVAPYNSYYVCNQLYITEYPID